MAKKKARLKVYDVKQHEQPKRRFDGYVKHPWYLVAGAALVGGILGALFFWRRKKL